MPDPSSPVPKLFPILSKLLAPAADAEAPDPAKAGFINAGFIPPP